MRHNGLTIATIAERIGRSAFHRLFRPEVLALDNDRMTLAIRVHWRPDFERQPGTGQWHGGILAALVDIAGCYGLMLVAGGQLLTLNFSTDFLRLAATDHLVARAAVRRAGRSVGFVEVEIEDAGGAIVATGRACYAIRPDIPQT